MLFETQLREVGNYGNIASVKKKTPLTLLVSLEKQFRWRQLLRGLPATSTKLCN